MAQHASYQPREGNPVRRPVRYRQQLARSRLARYPKSGAARADTPSRALMQVRRRNARDAKDLEVGFRKQAAVANHVAVSRCRRGAGPARQREPRIVSASRAYVGGESFWSKAQKEAVYSLFRYAQTRAEADYADYREAIAVPLGDRQARLELEKPEPDLAIVREGFIAGKNDPDESPE